jgi:hypothetical protein
VAVLIITNEQDLGADYVVLELERRHVAVLRCNAERFAQWRVFLRPGRDWRLFDPQGRQISSGSTSGIWWRRPGPPTFDIGLSAGESRALVDQWQAVAEGLASVPGPRWVSPPAAIAAAEDKARQLAAAQQLGFAVPETVWTNDLARARSLAADGRTVVKTVTAAHWEDGHEAAFVFARPLELADLPSDASSFASAPAALQAKVDPKRDVRVTVVGSSVLAAETSTANLDWRVEPQAEWASHELSDDVTDKCRRLVAALGLHFGGIDLVLDANGTYWFLEINPNGEWGWLQHCGLPIASALADVLAAVDV